VFIFKGHVKDPSAKAVALSGKEEEEEEEEGEVESVFLRLSHLLAENSGLGLGPLLASASLLLAWGGTRRAQTHAEEGAIPVVDKQECGYFGPVDW
jgi:hypothetical protein